MTWTLAAAAGLCATLLIFARSRRDPQIATESSRSSYPAAPPVPKAEPERITQRPVEPDTPPAKTCPVCLGEYPGTHRFCVRDGAPLADGHASGAVSQGLICPTCRRGYPADAGFCPEDADELVPFGLFGAASATRPSMRLDGHKICPECGVRHATVHLFCGHDGVELVVVN